MIIECQDFSNTRFDPASFDLVWALESACYAIDKRAFVAEVARLLKPGGRVAIADGFIKKRDLSAAEQRILDLWRQGWVVPNIISLEQLLQYLEGHGFSIMKSMDITDNVRRTSMNMYRFSRLMYPVSKILVRLGIWPEQKSEHWHAGVQQFHIFSQGIGLYGLVCARKVCGRAEPPSNGDSPGGDSPCQAH